MKKRPYPSYIGSVEEELEFLKHELSDWERRKIETLDSRHIATRIRSNIALSRATSKRNNAKTLQYVAKTIETRGMKNPLSLLHKQTLLRDMRRLAAFELDITRFANLTIGDVMKQTQQCANCGHTLMMHTGGPCLACTKCQAFVPKEPRPAERIQKQSNQGN